MYRFLFPPALAVLLFAGGAAPAPGDKEDKKVKRPDKEVKEPKSYQVPYRTTIPKHIVVRTKINGKGPFNFILDTGAPALHVATEVARKAGVKSGADGWAVLDTLAIEGGIKLEKVKAHVETPFQLEGMNGMGLAGVELHGLMGYMLVARYRMEIDFTKDKMTWTELDFDPPFLRLGKGKGGQGGLEMYGSVMKTLGKFMGRKAAPPVVLRGFLGLSLETGDESPVIKGVLEKSPAAEAGVRVDDVLTHVNDRTVVTPGDVIRVLRGDNKLLAGSEVKLTVKRQGEKKDITFKSSEGI